MAVQVDTYGPTSSSNTKLISYSEVLHFKWSYDSALPWVGVGPDARAPVTGRLHGALESSLAGEVSGPQGSDIPVPQSLEKGGDEDDAEADPMFDLTRDIRGLRGSVALVETAFAGFGEGRAESPAKDWIVNRKGPNPPDSLIELRQQSFERILASFGIPSALFGRTDATSRREAWREYLHSGLHPLAEIIAEDVVLKLDGPNVTISMDRLFSSDLDGQGEVVSITGKWRCGSGEGRRRFPD